jgi:dTDP-4-amino-4,6-dideoxygalactose transaminase
LRKHGEHRKYEHSYLGYTARLDTIQAAVLLRKLTFLDRWNDERRAAARFYAEQLDGVGDIRLPDVHAGSDHVWHLYVVQTSERRQLASFLGGRGIGTGRHYPQPLHLAPAYSQLGFRVGAFPVAERLAAEVLSLPLFPGITEQQQTAVASAVREYFQRG